jgi:hypothetical protein
MSAQAKLKPYLEEWWLVTRFSENRWGTHYFSLLKLNADSNKSSLIKVIAISASLTRLNRRPRRE